MIFAKYLRHVCARSTALIYFNLIIVTDFSKRIIDLRRAYSCKIYIWVPIYIGLKMLNT